MIPQGETLSASDTESLNLPWNGQQDVMIECQTKSNLTYQNIGELMIAMFYNSLAKGFGPFLRGIWAGLKVLF